MRLVDLEIILSMIIKVVKAGLSLPEPTDFSKYSIARSWLLKCGLS